MGLFSFGKKKERVEYYPPLQSTSRYASASATITPPRYYNTPPSLPPRPATLPALPPPLTPTKHPTTPNPYSTPPPQPRPTPPRPATTPRQSTAPNQCSGTTANHCRCTRTVNSATNLTPAPLRPSPSPFAAPSGPSPSPTKSSAQSSPRKSVKSNINSLDKLDIVFRSIQLNQPSSPSAQPQWVPCRQSLSSPSPPANEEAVPRFCHQHSKQALVERGAFITGTSGKGEWVEFADWINEDLPGETRAALRYEMTRPLTGRDTVGYIYVHEFVEKRSNQSPHRQNGRTELKVGRSINPVARLSQWRGQCPSREPIVRCIFPTRDMPTHPQPLVIGRIASSPRGLGGRNGRVVGAGIGMSGSPRGLGGRNGRAVGAGIGMSGSLQVSSRGISNHKKWERLVLIELAGRSSLSPFTTPTATKHQCVDCDRIHCEIFQVDEGAYEEWVVEVIWRWMSFCRDVLA